MLLNIFVFSSTLVLEKLVTLPASINPTAVFCKSFRFSIHIVFYFYFETGSQVSQAALKLARWQVWPSLRDYQNVHHDELRVVSFALCPQKQAVSGLESTSLIYWVFDTPCFKLPRLLSSVLRDIQIWSSEICGKWGPAAIIRSLTFEAELKPEPRFTTLQIFELCLPGTSTSCSQPHEGV